MIDKKNITGIILSGGKSSRMGRDKALLSFNGTSFLQHSTNALNPFVTEILIVSNNPEHDAFGLKRLPDTIENAGPLAGIYTGLNHSKTEHNLVLSCDIPLINSIILQKLIDAVDEDSEIIQIESQGKSMPLIALYKKQCEVPFLKLLNDGERKLQYAVNQCKVKHVVLNESESLFTQNINTPEELKTITK